MLLFLFSVLFRSRARCANIMDSIIAKQLVNRLKRIKKNNENIDERRKKTGAKLPKLNTFIMLMNLIDSAMRVKCIRCFFYRHRVFSLTEAKCIGQRAREEIERMLVTTHFRQKQMNSTMNIDSMSRQIVIACGISERKMINYVMSHSAVKYCWL